MIQKQAVILLADGFEETEAVATGDVLKRLGIAVQFAGVNTEYVTSTAGVTIKAHTLLDDVDWSTKDAVILPGGLPGAENLRDSSEVMEVLRKMNADGKVVAAICAAPIALERAGLVRGKAVTGYPGTNAGLEDLVYTGNRAEQDGNLVTGKGPGASFDFAAQIAKALGKTQEDVDKVFDGMFVLR